MDVLGFVAVVILGFVACAEFASYAFVHPVIRRLPPDHHLRVEQGLLRTFGVIMPIGMPGGFVLTIANVVRGTARDDGGPFALRLIAMIVWSIGIVSTVVVNVPINLSTGRLDADAPPPDWADRRGRWERFQSVRAWLFLVGFILTAAAMASND
jgi:uncharacterized membrane protein